jgi:hypothetical protein
MGLASSIALIPKVPTEYGLRNLRCKPTWAAGQSHACASRILMQTTQTIRVTSEPSLLVGCCLFACHSTWQTMRWQTPAPTGAQMSISTTSCCDQTKSCF